MRKTLTTTVLVLALACQASARPAQDSRQDEAALTAASVVKLYGEGKYEEALPLAHKVVELREKSADEELLAAALTNLAAVQQRLWKLDEARKNFSRALSIYERAGKGDSPAAIAARHNLALTEESSWKAIELHEKNLAAKERASGADSMDVTFTLFPLAHTLELGGEYDKALKHLERFVRIREGLKGAPAGDTAVALFRQACLLRKLNKDEDAKRAEERAREMLSDLGTSLGPVVEGGVINGKVISKPQPAYPAEAKRLRAQGTIKVQLLVGESGTVLSACARDEGHASLKRASEAAAYGARFTPTTVNGKPVKVTGVITYNFVLR